MSTISQSPHQRPYRTAVVGGGAAGFFAAINLKEQAPDMEVTIHEGSRRPLMKVELSGGGRCNLSNTFVGIDRMESVYPRGHRLMRRLFCQFSPADTYQWFERHGLKLFAEGDGRIFPITEDAHSVSTLLKLTAARLGVKVLTHHSVLHLNELQDTDYVIVTIGGSPALSHYTWIEEVGHRLRPPLPSLFALAIDDAELRSLAGLTVEHAELRIAGTNMKSTGALLLTHRGLSGPGLLRLTSYAAPLLKEKNYTATLLVNWTGMPVTEVERRWQHLTDTQGNKHLMNTTFDGLPVRLWQMLLQKAIPGERARELRPIHLNQKERNRLLNILTADTYLVTGRTAHSDEFVTCGGVDLNEVNPLTLESKKRAGLFFAGEVLDIDGITGGFNLQAAWTTAYVVAKALSAYNC